MFRVFAGALAGSRHRRILLALPSLALAAGLPLAGLTAPAAHPGTGAARGFSAGSPALAQAPSPSPSDTAAGAAAGESVAAPVHLPLLTQSDGAPGAPAPRPRAGSLLQVPAVGLEVGVVDYGDCSGNTAMTRTSAVHFLCTPSAVTSFVGHNPGVFTPLLRTHDGDRVYYQHDGVQDGWVLTARYRVSPADAANYTQDGSYAHAVFATCAEPDSSAYWVLLASPIGGASPMPTAQPSQRPATPAGGGGAHPQPAPSPSPSPTPPGGITGPIPIPAPSPPPI